jgi:small subunit ribosomal protein S11
MRSTKYTNKSFCIIHINSTQNNTIITATDFLGQVLFSQSKGYQPQNKGGKKSVAMAAAIVASNISNLLMSKGYINSQIKVKGFGIGRERALRAILNSDIKICEIIDITKSPHNGCRPKKQRRV